MRLTSASPTWLRSSESRGFLLQLHTAAQARLRRRNTGIGNRCRSSRGMVEQQGVCRQHRQAKSTGAERAESKACILMKSNGRGAQGETEKLGGGAQNEVFGVYDCRGGAFLRRGCLGWRTLSLRIRPRCLSGCWLVLVNFDVTQRVSLSGSLVRPW